MLSLISDILYLQQDSQQCRSNVSGMPILGSAESSLGVTNSVLGTTAIGFNSEGSALYQTIGEPSSEGYFRDPNGAFITYDPTPTRINWKKFLTKVVNVSRKVIAVAESLMKTDPAISVNNPILTKTMQNKVYMSNFSDNSPEQNTIINFLYQAGIMSTSDVYTQYNKVDRSSVIFKNWASGWNSVDYLLDII